MRRDFDVEGASGRIYLPFELTADIIQPSPTVRTMFLRRTPEQSVDKLNTPSGVTPAPCADKLNASCPLVNSK